MLINIMFFGYFILFNFALKKINVLIRKEKIAIFSLNKYIGIISII